MNTATAEQILGVRTYLVDICGAHAVRAADQLDPRSLTNRDQLGVHTWCCELQKLRARKDYTFEMERALLHSIPARDAAVFCRAMLDENFLLDAQDGDAPGPINPKTKDTPHA